MIIDQIGARMSDQQEPNRSIELGEGVSVATDALQLTFVRSGGPGGQAVNKLSTKARLRVAVEAIEGLSARSRERLRQLAGRRLTDADELLLVCETYRSQQDNRRACMERLRGLVRDALAAPPPRRRTRPSRASVERRLEEKRRRGERKQQRRPPDAE